MGPLMGPTLVLKHPPSTQLIIITGRASIPLFFKQSVGKTGVSQIFIVGGPVRYTTLEFSEIHHSLIKARYYVDKIDIF